MSGLGIENASIGYDEAGIAQVYEDIRANLIEETRNTLDQNVPVMSDNVDTYWRGASADAFKQKLADDTETVKAALKEIEEALKGEIEQMMYNVNNSDATVAESIAAQTGN